MYRVSLFVVTAVSFAFACGPQNKPQPQTVLGTPGDDAGAHWVTSWKSQPAADLSTGCDSGNAEACFVAGHIAEVQNSDLEAGLALYQKSCDLEFAFGCYVVGELENARKNIDVAMDYYRTACRLGEPSGCAAVAEANQDDRGLADACNRKAARACLALGWQTQSAKQTNVVESIRYYKSACRSGSIEGCARSAALQANECQSVACETEIPTDDAALRGWLEGGCSRNVVDACVYAAEFSKFDLKGTQNYCEKGSSWACVKVGDFHRRQDARRSFGYYEMACNDGFAHACAELGALGFEGAIVMPKKASAAYLRRACSGGAHHACVNLVAFCVSGSEEACSTPETP